MQVARHQLIGLLRSGGSEKTATMAERTLPETIDLDRDRALLRRCGIDPNVLGSRLSAGAGPWAADRAATPDPASGPVHSCPYCHRRFLTTDDVLDHLDTHASAPPTIEPDHVPVPTRISMSAAQVDAALVDLERALRRSHGRRFWVRTVLLCLLLVGGATLTVAVSAPLGLAVFALAAVLFAADAIGRRHELARGRERSRRP
jgi:hypothetical protein